MLRKPAISAGTDEPSGSPNYDFFLFEVARARNLKYGGNKLPTTNQRKILNKAEEKMQKNTLCFELLPAVSFV